jgi:hypothetical protein
MRADRGTPGWPPTSERYPRQFRMAAERTLSAA